MLFKLIKSIIKAQKELVLTEVQKQAVKTWNIDQIGSFENKVIVITGANSGIGFEAAKIFAFKKAKVILACRNELKLNQAIQKIKEQDSNADVQGLILDLSDLQSVRSAIAQLKSLYKQIDILCNNAGVMAPPYMLTKDGFELQIGTNHFGHFAFTLGLLPLLCHRDARIVNVSSMAHRMGYMDFGDLPKVEKYQSWIAYSQSKLANLLFTFGLKQKIESWAQSDQSISLPIVVACHPGYSATELTANGMKFKWYTKIWSPMVSIANAIFGQSAQQGSYPTLFASTHPMIQSGDYIGPSGFLYFRGYPSWEVPDHIAKQQEDIDKLWVLSEELTQSYWADLKR